MGKQICEGISYACLTSLKYVLSQRRSVSEKYWAKKGGMAVTVRNLEIYLKQLLDENRNFDATVVETIKNKAMDDPGLTEDELRFLIKNFLVKYRGRFDTTKTARDLARFLVLEAKGQTSSLERIYEMVGHVCDNLVLLGEAFRGQIEQLSQDGIPSPEEIKKVREYAKKLNIRGMASIVKVPPNANADKLLTAMRKAIHDIDGFGFLSHPPNGKKENIHTILIKVGVNWGYFSYPTVTSWESVYAITKLCLDQANLRGAKVEVKIGDESGIENRLWNGTTLHNFEQTGIFHAAVLAGLEHAASLEAADPTYFDGAGDLLKTLRKGHKVTSEGDALSERMIEMAARAGVEIIPFERFEFAEISLPKEKSIKHFQEGFAVPKIVVENVTDIINLPKPPGRHLIMGNTGLTGALKNHVGLFKADDRVPMLHGMHDRFPSDPRGQYGESYKKRLEAVAKDMTRNGKAVREYVHSVATNWSEHGPGMGFHEKIVEIYLAFKDKERFSVTDMRRTVSSLGPDFGDTIDIGAVIAAKDPVTLDALGGALLKRRYEEIGSWFDALKLGGDSFTEYLAGKTWLRNGNPFDLMSHIAANSYGVGPVDWKHIDLRHSGFTSREIKAIQWYLWRRSGPLPSRAKLYYSLGRIAALAAASLAVTGAALWMKAALGKQSKILPDRR